MLHIVDHYYISLLSLLACHSKLSSLFTFIITDLLSLLVCHSKLSSLFPFIITDLLSLLVCHNQLSSLFTFISLLGTMSFIKKHICCKYIISSTLCAKKCLQKIYMYMCISMCVNFCCYWFRREKYLNI